MEDGSGLDSYEVSFASGDYLFQEGDVVDSLYVLRSGRVDLLKVVDGHEYQVGAAVPGEFVGEVSSVGGMPQSVGAKATETVHCWVLNAETLESLVEADRELGVRMLIAMAKRIADTQNLLAVYASRDPVFRVCQALLHQAETTAQVQAEGVLVPERLTEMGARLKLRPDETAQVSKALMRNKLIRIRRDGVLLPDTSRLKEFLATDQSRLLGGN